MTANEVRQIFLDFFKSKGHVIVPSAPLVLKDDPTLIFSNSGMVQFKDYFLGNKVAANKRVADTQKCLRVSGKHNDLEEVGIDTYHHTLFEMLGNWSFGDYFKQDAIDWAWELLTEVYKLPKDRLYVTVFEGDAKENLAADSEAKAIWLKHIAEERILNGNKKDNFWEMGDQGPCGPCSEIHFDLRSDSERAEISGDKLVNNDHPQVIEIWNLVFMQFNRKADGSLESLPDKHVDTGMGFERLVRVIEGKHSNYDTDVFTPLLKHLEVASKKAFGKNEKIDIAMRVIADHVRAVSFTIADGELPSNNGAGYVIKRILRRAVRYGYTFLEFTEPFMHELVAVLAEQFKEIFPEIAAQKEFIAKVIFEEERAFLLTLEKGIKRFDEIKYSLSSTFIPGKLVFELYDTFGFPVDLTELLARESGMQLDKKGFEVAMKEQKDRSRAAAETEKSDWTFVVENADANQFVGYELLQAPAKILRYRQIADKKKTYFQLVLNQTPFYAESGGQVGDKGVLIGENGEKIAVSDTVKENDLIIHLIDKLPTNLTQNFDCQVNGEKRKLTENNHSCTHLLHAALRQVLGTHVMQKGSLVNEEVLRFDFSHFAKMTDEEIAKVEAIVNAKIRENISLNEQRNVPIEKAKTLGAMALFGEKYGDFVRVITFDQNYSVELCGGTHVKATGQIGLFKIVSESSIAAGVRRIEAVTADKAELFISEQLNVINDLKELLKNPKDLNKAVTALLDEKAKLQKEIERLQAKEITALKNDLLTKVTAKGDVNFLAERVELPSAEALKTLSFQLKNQIDNLFSVLVSEIDGKAHIAVMISENLTEAKSLDAAKIVKELAALVQGGGGGQKFFATAAGKNPAGIAEVLKNAEIIAENPIFEIPVPIKEKEVKTKPVNSSITKPFEVVKAQEIKFDFDKTEKIISICTSYMDIKTDEDRGDARNYFFSSIILDLNLAKIIFESHNYSKNRVSDDFNKAFYSYLQTNLFFGIFMSIEELMNRIAEKMAITQQNIKPKVDAIIEATTKKQEHYRLFEIWIFTRNTIHNRGFHGLKTNIIPLEGKNYVFEENCHLSWFDFDAVQDLTYYLVQAVQEILSCENVKSIGFIQDRFDLTRFE